MSTPPAPLVERVFTFGYGHTEPVTGESLAETYALVRAATVERCRQIMNDRYPRWSQEYETLFAASVGSWSPRLHVTLIDGPTGATAVYARPAGGSVDDVHIEQQATQGGRHADCLAGPGHDMLACDYDAALVEQATR